MGFFSERLHDAAEWVREGDEEYVLQKKRAPLLEKLASLKEWQNNITPHLGDAASKLDTPTATNIPHLKHIEEQIAAVEAQLAALEDPSSKN